MASGPDLSSAATELTDRQRRELEYHRSHARENERLLASPFSYEVLESRKRRWWNAYWRMYDHLLTLDLRDKEVLVVGCGFGDDALRLAKLGARVSAFDLSPESIDIARALAKREGLSVAFEQMPAEAMRYGDDKFDYVIARDILHHVDIPRTMREIVRVSKPGGVLVVNEMYSHSVTDKIRRSALVERFLYPKMQKFIYGGEKPYITEDERKLTEEDVRQIASFLKVRPSMDYYNFVVTRLLPEQRAIAKVDRVLLQAARPLRRWLAGRVLFLAPVAKQEILAAQA
jgi:2-polyprenyl-3-methyl-5-hydroxy-6-metoxy-1,4-benzoquinol methylase